MAKFKDTHDDSGKPVPLVPEERPHAPLGDEVKPPPHATPVESDPGGPVPRVVDQLERAPAGFQRFKIRAENYTSIPVTKYVLAKKGDREGAEKHYREVTGIDRQVKRLTDAKVEKVDPPLLVVTELAD